MSSSAFHRGFKASTGLSPPQYRKHLSVGSPWRGSRLGMAAAHRIP
ncbi:helix-turn-helix transcriptional regulator [Devosia sp. 1566]